MTNGLLSCGACDEMVCVCVCMWEGTVWTGLERALTRFWEWVDWETCFFFFFLNEQWSSLAAVSSAFGVSNVLGPAALWRQLPAHSQLRRSQDSRNERPMNGLFCATITELGQEGNGQRSSAADGQHPARKTRESTLRNYSGMPGSVPKTKNPSHIQWNLIPFRLLWRNGAIPRNPGNAGRNSWKSCALA